MSSNFYLRLIVVVYLPLLSFICNFLDSEAKMTGMENEMKLKDEELDTLMKCKDELATRIAQLEDELKAAKITEKSKPTQFMLHAKFNEISKLDYERVYSEPTVSTGITWKMSMRKLWIGGDLEFLLHAEKENAVEWCCPVTAQFRVISQKSKRIVHKVEKKHIFDTENSSKTIGLFSAHELSDDGEEFVVNDLINIAVAIRTFPISLYETAKISLRAKFSDISKLSEGYVYSEPTDAEGIIWKISLRKGTGGGIYVYLHAKQKDAFEWWCPVIIDLQLVSQKTGDIVHIARERKIYDADDTSMYIGVIWKKDLFDEVKGFVKDDAIIVVMDIKAFLIN